MKYVFWLEVTETLNGETVRLEWDGLTLAEAEKMHKLTLTKYAPRNGYVAEVERFGWKEMK